MRRWTVRTLHASAVLLSFVLVLEGPDLLLLAVLDARRWLPVGLVSGLLTLPLLWTVGVGFAPPWTLPYYDADTPRRRVVGYHLTCCILAAWLWTVPTLHAVAWVHAYRGFAGTTGVPTDPVSVAAGLALAGLLFFAPTLVLFVRLSAFWTAVDLYETRARDLLRPGVVAVGVPLGVALVVCLLASLVATGP